MSVRVFSWLNKNCKAVYLRPSVFTCGWKLVFNDNKKAALAANLC